MRASMYEQKHDCTILPKRFILFYDCVLPLKLFLNYYPAFFNVMVLQISVSVVLRFYTFNDVIINSVLSLFICTALSVKAIQNPNKKSVHSAIRSLTTKEIKTTNQTDNHKNEL